MGRLTFRCNDPFESSEDDEEEQISKIIQSYNEKDKKWVHFNNFFQTSVQFQFEFQCLIIRCTYWF